MWPKTTTYLQDMGPIMGAEQMAPSRRSLVDRLRRKSQVAHGASKSNVARAAGASPANAARRFPRSGRRCRLPDPPPH